MLLFILCNVLSILIVLCHYFDQERFETYGNIAFFFMSWRFDYVKSTAPQFCDFASKFMVQAAPERLRGNARQ